MKYLIVGASGLIGSYLTKNLLKNHNVYALSRRNLGYTDPNLTWVEHDLTKPLNIAKLPKDIDAVIYLAQSEFFRDFPKNTIDLFDVNVKRYLEILNFCVENNIKKVVYASSGGVYEQHDKAFSEDDKLSVSGNLGFYLGSKLCGEIISSAYSEILNIQILRFFFVFGPGQKADMLIPRLINNVKQGNFIKLSGEEGIRINPIHVDDAVEAIKTVLKNDASQTYNVGGDMPFSLKEIVQQIADIVGKEAVIEHIEGHSADVVGSIEKIKKLGWSPQLSFSDALKTMV